MISWWFRTTFVKVTTDLQNVRGREVTSKPEGHCQFRLSLSEVLLTHFGFLGIPLRLVLLPPQGPPLFLLCWIALCWPTSERRLLRAWAGRLFLISTLILLGISASPKALNIYKVMTTRFLSLALTFPRLLTLPFVCRRHSTHTINVFQIKFLILLVSFSSYF